jgi:DNA polymerase-3 subunit gamma/tau
VESLATLYRPKTFDEVVSQVSVVKILERQIELQEFKNAYLFAGASGCGKTTIARIFANKINGGVGSPIEIDAASNNGVDNVKTIIKEANERAIDSKYKIYIIDECHSLTSQAWQAFLKCIEEPPKYTIFIFCTTDPQKIPDTIKNRVQKYTFSRIGVEKVRERLAYICRQEGFTNYEESVDYLARISDGGMRNAISYLDKCSGYSTDMCIENVLASLGNYSYNTFFSLINSMIDGDEGAVLRLISDFYDEGNDLKLFVEQFLNFCMDVTKYALFKDCSTTRIPASMEDKLIHSTNIDGASKYYMYVVDKLLGLKNMLKNDTSPRATIEITFLQITRCA